MLWFDICFSIVFPFFLMNFYLWHFLPNQRKKYFSFLMCHMLFIKKNKPLSPQNYSSNSSIAFRSSSISSLEAGSSL